MSSYTPTSAELDILKNGLKYGLGPPRRLKITDVAPSFESISLFLSSNLKIGVSENQMKAELSALAHDYVSSYQPSQQTLRKHGILKRLRQNKDIVICKPDKGNSVVIMDRVDYNQRMLELISDKSKFVKRKVIGGR